MAASIFYLKRNDTLPILRVPLLDPDGSAHDLTGSTGWELRIYQSDGTYLVRTMIVEDAAPLLGVVTYQWLTTDWAAGSTGAGTKADPFAVGGLIVGPSLPLARTAREHRMEVEVTGSGGARLTFPNGGVNAGESYIVLRVWDDLGD